MNLKFEPNYVKGYTFRKEPVIYIFNYFGIDPQFHHSILDIKCNVSQTRVVDRWQAGRQAPAATISQQTLTQSVSVCVCVFVWCAGNQQRAGCDVCSAQTFFGTRWKCCECDDYDLCDECYHGDMHDVGHEFRRLDLLTSQGYVRMAVNHSAGHAHAQALLHVLMVYVCVLVCVNAALWCQRDRNQRNRRLTVFTQEQQLFRVLKTGCLVTLKVQTGTIYVVVLSRLCLSMFGGRKPTPQSQSR